MFPRKDKYGKILELGFQKLFARENKPCENCGQEEWVQLTETVGLPTTLLEQYICLGIVCINCSNIRLFSLDALIKEE